MILCGFHARGEARRESDLIVIEPRLEHRNAELARLRRAVGEIDAVGFHARQAIEKWLKAVIASRGEDFEFTHDLHRLVMLTSHGTGELPFDVDLVLILTQYAAPLRYEDLLDAEPLDREATVALVEEVGRWATSQLGD